MSPVYPCPLFVFLFNRYLVGPYNKQSPMLSGQNKPSLEPPDLQLKEKQAAVGNPPLATVKATIYIATSHEEENEIKMYIF